MISGIPDSRHFVTSSSGSHFRVPEVASLQTLEMLFDGMRTLSSRNSLFIVFIGLSLYGGPYISSFSRNFEAIE